MKTASRKVLLALFGLLLMTNCSSYTVPETAKNARLDKALFHSFDGDIFPYRKWTPKEEPELVIIGVHGISGAAADYVPLGNHILSDLPKTALYGAETRGQGNDPVRERRGHIHHREEWFRDLTTFTRLIRKKHPAAKIVWCGESMGSLIVLHTYAHSEDRTNLCDAMVLSSPITDIRGDFPRWKEWVAKTAAALFPKARVSLESLSGKDEVRVTKNTIHQEQVETNSYHIKRHTLRLLATLGDMIRMFKEAGQKLDIPLLVLHGGKDVFSDPKDVEKFTDSLPEKTKVTRKFYPESFHLLFHDHQSEKVVADIADWLRKLSE